MRGNARFLPVHSHCVANDCNLPTLFVKILYVLALSMLLIIFQSQIHFHFLLSANFSSAFLAWFSHLNLISYERVPKFLFSVTLLAFLFPYWYAAICCSGTPLSTSCVSGHFNKRWNSLSSPAKWRHLSLSSPLRSFHFPDSQPEPCYLFHFFLS